jgi:hypothetical protein
MRSLLMILVLCAGVFAQTTFRGRATTLYGATTTINPGSSYTKIYVFNPPQSNTPPAANYTNFVSNVMTQNAIDGVTIPVQWNWVEADALPTSTPCSPVGTDVCQQDPVAATYYHTYSWATVDGPNGNTLCSDPTTGSSSQWFCDFPNGSGNYKKVNFELYGLGSGSPFTPAYVTSTSWISATSPTYLHLDAVNNVNAGSCAGYSGAAVPSGTIWTGGGQSPYSTITVTNWTPSVPFVDGDNIWVSGTAVPAAFTATGQYGTSQYGGTVHLLSSTSFSYTGSGTSLAVVTGPNPNFLTTVSALQSWIVPYESPYSSAYQAFLKAAIYHFNNLYTLMRPHQTVSQIAYIRPGVARRGEATPLCTSELMASGSVQTSPAYLDTVWLAWYSTVNAAVQAASPRMQIIFAIDAGDPLARDATYATREAGIAVSTSNAVGAYNGFGSEGLEQSDISTYNASTCPGSSGTAPNTSENWGCMFATYWSGASGSIGSMAASPTTVPLELQQVDCSNPTGYAGGSGSCFLASHPPGLTGDLRTLYTFATSHYASILELYSQDALLAYDPNFCDSSAGCSPTGGSCKLSSGYDWFSTILSADEQCNFYENVGDGVTCAAGGCYATAVNNAHGYH